MTSLFSGNTSASIVNAQIPAILLCGYRRQHYQAQPGIEIAMPELQKI
jgi:hypothetical protein